MDVLAKVEEATLHRKEKGLVPGAGGWFVVNIAESKGLPHRAVRRRLSVRGDVRRLPRVRNQRSRAPARPARIDVSPRSCARGVLVLSGECIAVVEDQEQPMRKGDFLHSPPGTAHVLVGAGEGPCAVLMVGVRKQPMEIEFPASEAAARYGASVQEDTDDRSVAYAGVSPPQPAAFSLPW